MRIVGLISLSSLSWEQDQLLRGLAEKVVYIHCYRVKMGEKRGKQDIVVSRVTE